MVWAGTPAAARLEKAIDLLSGVSPLSILAMRLASSKARGIPKACTAGVVEAVIKDGDLRRPSQFITVMRIWGRKRPRAATQAEEATVSRSAAKNMAHDRMLLYLATLRKSFVAMRHCSISLDALRVGGTEIPQGACFDTGTELACGLPPQVPACAAARRPRTPPHGACAPAREA